MNDRLQKLEEALEWQACDVCAGVRPRKTEPSDGPQYDDCSACLRKYGPVLVKCAMDVWPVVVRLKSGVLFVASSCDLKGDWVTFVNKEGFNPLDFGAQRHTSTISNALSGRGLCVALADIAWAIDTDS